MFNAKCIWDCNIICVIILKRVYQSPSVLVNNLSVVSSKLNLLKAFAAILTRIYRHKIQIRVSTVQFKFYRPIVDHILKSNNTAKTPVLNSTPPVLWEVHTKLVLILTPVGASLTIWYVIQH